MSCAMDQCTRYGHRSLHGLGRNLSADIRRFLTKSADDLARGDGFRQRLSALLRPELQCLMLYRIAHWLHLKGCNRLAVLVGRCNLLLHKVNITPQSCIGPGCRLSHPATVLFHGRAGRDLTLFSQAVCAPAGLFPDGSPDTGPSLGDRVTLGGLAAILGAVTVGDDVKIGMSICLDHDAPSGVLVVSRVTRTRFRPSAGAEHSVSLARA